MTTQDNVNQINNNSTSVENYNINENENVSVDNKNEIYLTSLVKGKYDMFFSHFHVVHLFIDDKHYCINDYESSSIYYTITKEFKLEVDRKEEKNNVPYDVFKDVILEVECKDDKTSIYVRLLNEEAKPIKEKLIKSYNSLLFRFEAADCLFFIHNYFIVFLCTKISKIFNISKHFSIFL